MMGNPAGMPSLYQNQMMGANDMKNIDPLHIQYMVPNYDSGQNNQNIQNYGIGSENMSASSQMSGLSQQFRGMQPERTESVASQMTTQQSMPQQVVPQQVVQQQSPVPQTGGKLKRK
jgi:hypothetical protein